MERRASPPATPLHAQRPIPSPDVREITAPCVKEVALCALAVAGGDASAPQSSPTLQRAMSHGHCLQRRRMARTVRVPLARDLGKRRRRCLQCPAHVTWIVCQSLVPVPCPIQIQPSSRSKRSSISFICIPIALAFARCTARSLCAK